MNFCSECGAAVQRIIPDGDDRPRYVCASCGVIHYRNPKIVVGCIPEYGDRILLARRAIEPRLGAWTLPAGYMENGESVAEGARRETWEETRAVVEDLSLFGVFSIIHIHQVYMMFRGRLAEKTFSPTPESSEVRLFSEADIPWDAISFRVVEKTLKRYFADQSAGAFDLHTEDINIQKKIT